MIESKGLLSTPLVSNTYKYKNVFKLSILTKILYIIYLFIFLFIKFDISIMGNNISFSFIILLLIILIIIIDSILTKTSVYDKISKDKFIEFLFIFLIICFIVSCFKNPSLSSGIEGIFRVISWILTFYIAQYFSMINKFRKYILYIIFLSTVFYSLLCFKAIFLDKISPILITFISNNRNSFAHYIANVAPLVLLSIKFLRKNIFLLIIYVALIFVTIMITLSRGGLISWVISLGVIMLMLRNSKNKLWILAIPSIIIFVLFIYYYQNFGNQFQSIYNLNIRSSNYFRLELIFAGVNMGFHNPLFGVGYNQFPYQLTRYASYIFVNSIENGFYPHNDYIKIFAETGLLSLLILIILLVYILLKILKTLKYYDNNQNILIKDNRYIKISILASLISLIVSGISTTALSNVFGWFLLGIIHGISQK